MKTEILITMTRDEVNSRLPYRLICETMGSERHWDNRKRRTRWAAEFTEEGREECEKLYRLAYKWYLRTGVPDEVTMSLRTLCLWDKLAEFCASL